MALAFSSLEAWLVAGPSSRRAQVWGATIRLLEWIRETERGKREGKLRIRQLSKHVITRA
jgi:hypothetical protein